MREVKSNVRACVPFLLLVFFPLFDCDNGKKNSLSKGEEREREKNDDDDDVSSFFHFSFFDRRQQSRGELFFCFRCSSSSSFSPSFFCEVCLLLVLSTVHSDACFVSLSAASAQKKGTMRAASRRIRGLKPIFFSLFSLLSNSSVASASTKKKKPFSHIIVSFSTPLSTTAFQTENTCSAFEMFACFTPKPGDSPEQQQHQGGGGKASSASGGAPIVVHAGGLPRAPPRAPQLSPPAGVLSGPAGTHARAFARALVEKAEYR